MKIEKLLRQSAYRILLHKDGYHHVISHKREFEEFRLKPSNILKKESFNKLKKILIHAYQNTSYYYNLLESAGFSPYDLIDFYDLEKIPLLKKDSIVKNKDQMVARSISAANLEKSYTGGTTGTHTSFYRDKKCTEIRMGRQLGILDLSGYEIGDRCGLIWGLDEELTQNAEKFSLKKEFRKFATGKESICCASLDADKMFEFQKRMINFRPKVFYGYPNAMAHFAEFITEKSLQKIKVKTIISTAERLSDKHRKLLSNVFSGEVFDIYCTREHGCIGFECQQHNGYHIDIGSVYIEIMQDKEGDHNGRSGEIVVTDLCNYGMPFIRYRTGDRGRIIQGKRCKCGSQLPILAKLDGRETELVYRPDGRAVTVMDVITDIPGIKAIQVIQEKLEAVDLLLVASKSYTEDTGKRAVQELGKQLGNQMKIHLKLVDEISVNPRSGKFQEVISRIPPSSRPSSQCMDN